MNIRQKTAVVILDVAILAELSFSIFWANQDPDNITPLFFRYFFGMLVPTLILARIVIKRLASPPDENRGFELGK